MLTISVPEGKRNGSPQATSEPRPEYVNLSGLKKHYGLCGRWIARLGAPDTTADNPYYRSAAPMKLWKRARVERFIAANREEYDQHLDRRARRSAAGTRQAVVRREALVKWAKSAPITCSPFPPNLTTTCSQSLSALDTPYLDVTDRRIINMLRHEFTNYEELLDDLKGKVGRWHAYPIIRARVNAVVCARTGLPNTLETTGGDADEVARLRAAWGDDSGAAGGDA